MHDSHTRGAAAPVYRATGIRLERVLLHLLVIAVAVGSVSILMLQVYAMVAAILGDLVTASIASAAVQP